MCAFADDISIVVRDKILDNVIDKINSALNNISTYFYDKKLVINQEKTVSLHFHTVRALYTSSLLVKLNKKSTEQVTTFKLLGINIDVSLDWKSRLLCL